MSIPSQYSNQQKRRSNQQVTPNMKRLQATISKLEAQAADAKHKRARVVKEASFVGASHGSIAHSAAEGALWDALEQLEDRLPDLIAITNEAEDVEGKQLPTQVSASVRTVRELPLELSRLRQMLAVVPQFTEVRPAIVA